jgi:hypothetical protein
MKISLQIQKDEGGFILGYANLEIPEKELQRPIEDFCKIYLQPTFQAAKMHYEEALHLPAGISESQL